MSEYFPEPTSSGGRVNVQLGLSDYATKGRLKNATGVDISDFAKKTGLANLKCNVDNLDIEKLKNVPRNLKQFEK